LEKKVRWAALLIGQSLTTQHRSNSVSHYVTEEHGDGLQKGKHFELK
jgi:hypothetical protein